VFRRERNTFIYWPYWMHFNNLFSVSGPTWNNYLHLFANWMHLKSLIWKGVPTWKNYLHLLANWMHSKSFVYTVNVPT
jgi:hypothetical protein